MVDAPRFPVVGQHFKLRSEEQGGERHHGGAFLFSVLGAAAATDSC